MRKLFASAALSAAVLVAGCAGMPAPQSPPQSPEQAAFLAKGTYDAVSKTTGDYLQQGVISVDTAETIQHHLAEYKPVLNSAVKTVRSGGSLSDQKLEAVRQIQSALQGYQDWLEAKKEGN